MRPVRIVPSNSTGAGIGPSGNRKRCTMGTRESQATGSDSTAMKQAIEIYRTRFEPSDQLGEPYLISRLGSSGMIIRPPRLQVPWQARAARVARSPLRDR